MDSVYPLPDGKFAIARNMKMLETGTRGRSSLPGVFTADSFWTGSEWKQQVKFAMTFETVQDAMDHMKADPENFQPSFVT